MKDDNFIIRGDGDRFFITLCRNLVGETGHCVAHEQKITRLPSKKTGQIEEKTDRISGRILSI